MLASLTVVDNEAHYLFLLPPLCPCLLSYFESLLLLKVAAVLPDTHVQRRRLSGRAWSRSRWWPGAQRQRRTCGHIKS